MSSSADRDLALELLRQFTEAPGPSGHEDAVRGLVRRHLGETSAHRFTADRTGSLLCSREQDPQAGPRVMLTAHMDEVGFLVQSITPDGFLQFVPLGGWWSHTLLAQRVHILNGAGESILGVISSTPPHLLTESARDQLMPLDRMYIDVGASSLAEVTGKFGIRVGDPIVPASAFEVMRNPDLLLAKAFDNRVGVALLVQTLLRLQDRPLPCQLLGVATVQEELGLRGARTASRLAQPDVALVLEGPPADDTPGLPPHQAQGVLGRGVQIRVFDPTAVMNRRLVDFCLDTARECGIPHQITARRAGGTDAGSIHLEALGVPCVVLGVPARYIHSHNAVLHLGDYLHALHLVEELLDRLTPERVAGFTDFLG